MLKLPPLPKSELEVARIVWQLGEATVRQVAEALSPQRGLDFFTVQTYLRRLEAKGYLKKRRVGRSNVYRPRLRPDHVMGRVVRDFIQRVFDGRALPLVQHLIEDRGLTTEEIDTLQHLLDELKAKQQRAKP